MDSHIVDDDGIGRGAEQTGNLAINAVKSELLCARIFRSVLHINGKDRRALRVANEKNVFRAKGQSARGFQVRCADNHASVSCGSDWTNWRAHPRFHGKTSS